MTGGRVSVLRSRLIFLRVPLWQAKRRRGTAWRENRPDLCEDPMLGEENWEKAESMLQIKAIQLALERSREDTATDSLYFCRRFVRGSSLPHLWCGRAGNSLVWTVWSLFYLWRPCHWRQ